MRFTSLAKQAIAIAVLVLFLLAQVQPARASTSQFADAEFFKVLMGRSYEAWNTQNPDAIAAFFLNDPSLVVYDATPLKYQGWQEFKSGIQVHLFDKLNRFQLTANDDLVARQNGDLVWTTFTYHLSAESINGETIEVEGRQTDLWQQYEGQWLIVHEHTSTPVNL